MATQSFPPFYGGQTQSGGGLARTMPNGSQQRLALDNLIRRELKVADPSDAAQVAQALLARYQDDPRARAISQEAQGLPFLLNAPAAAPVTPSTTSSSAEWDQAVSDVNRDLQELTTNAILKDVSPELQGWAQAVRSAIREGVNAARFALDARQRDKAFAIRRQLGDYARMARLIGALTSAVNANYRKFAQSLDEAAAVLLVMMGEALSNVGFAGGRFLLQAPYSELQVRRDAVIYAMRNLVGATQEAYGPNDWPRGLDAYRRLFDTLEEQGQGDLRALLVENELARTMDELIQRAAQGTADGLRALGSTAQLDLERFRRLVIVGQRAVSPESPPLTSFLEALALFADAFDTSGGFRLMRIARPPILFYGLYGTSGLDSADRRLLSLITDRGLLADLLDCFMSCACADDAVRCQIILDKILYDVDRAIDLYAVGKEDFGQPERRAAAYSYVIDYFLNFYSAVVDPRTGRPTCDLGTVVRAPDGTLEHVLSRIQDTLRPSLSGSEISTVISDLLSFATALARALQNNFLCVAPANPNSSAALRSDISNVDTSIPLTDATSFPVSGLVSIDGEVVSYTGKNSNALTGARRGAEGTTAVLHGQRTPVVTVVDLCTAISNASVPAPSDLIGLTQLFRILQYAYGWLVQNGIQPIPTPPLSIGAFLGILQQELCIQQDMEARWQNLVQTMAPDCVPSADVFSAVGQVIGGAIRLVSGIACPPSTPSIPPHFETSLDGLVENVLPTGANRRSFQNQP